MPASRWSTNCSPPTAKRRRPERRRDDPLPRSRPGGSAGGRSTLICCPQTECRLELVENVVFWPGIRPHVPAKDRFGLEICDNAATVRRFLSCRGRIRLKRQQLPPFLACRNAKRGMNFDANARPVAYGVDRSRSFCRVLYAKRYASLQYRLKVRSNRKGAGSDEEVCFVGSRGGCRSGSCGASVCVGYAGQGV